MAGIVSGFKQAIGAVFNAGKSIKKTFTPSEGEGFFKSLQTSFKGWSESAMNEARSVESATKPAASGFWAGVGSVVAFPFKLIGKAVAIPFGWVVSGMKASAKAGIWFAEKPVELGLFGVRKGAEFVGRHPGGTLAGVGVGTVAGVGIWAKNRAERQTMESYQQAAAQMQAAQSYMNSVTPQEAAALEARMRQGGNSGSMAQMEEQRRAAAAQAAAPVAG